MMLKTCILERHTKTSKIFINNSLVYVFTESSDEYGFLRFGALLHVLGSEGHTAVEDQPKMGCVFARSTACLVVKRGIFTLQVLEIPLPSISISFYIIR